MRWISSGWFLGAMRWGDKHIGAVICHKGIWKGLLYKKPPLTMSNINISWSASKIENLGILKVEYLSAPPQLNCYILLQLSNIALNWCEERNSDIYEGFTNALFSSEPVKNFAIFAANQWGIGVVKTIEEVKNLAKLHNYKNINIDVCLKVN